MQAPHGTSHLGRWSAERCPCVMRAVVAAAYCRSSRIERLLRGVGGAAAQHYPCVPPTDHRQAGGQALLRDQERLGQVRLRDLHRWYAHGPRLPSRTHASRVRCGRRQDLYASRPTQLIVNGASAADGTWKNGPYHTAAPVASFAGNYDSVSTYTEFPRTSRHYVKAGSVGDHTARIRAFDDCGNVADPVEFK